MTLRVLIVKTTSMGDVLHTLPALTEAAKYCPDIQFDWVVEEGFAQIPTWHFAVDKVIPVAIRRWRKSWFSAETKKERAHFIQTLRARHYDLIIDAQGLIKSALITRKAFGTKHGYDRKSIKEPLASFFYDIKHYVSKKMHAVDRIRQLFAQSLDYSISLHEQGDYAIAGHFTKLERLEQPKYLMFLHSTTRDEKHWTQAHWIDLIKIAKAQGYKVKLPWGSEKEYQRAIFLAQGFDNVIVLPKLTLSEIATELASATAIVSVDTGLSHLAAALDRPNITLFGPTDPSLIGGYGKNQNRIKAIDNKMNSIQANIVWEKLQSYL